MIKCEGATLARGAVDKLKRFFFLWPGIHRSTHKSDGNGETWLQGRAKVTGLILFLVLFSCLPELWGPASLKCLVCTCSLFKTRSKRYWWALTQWRCSIICVEGMCREEWTSVWFVCLVCDLLCAPSSRFFLFRCWVHRQGWGSQCSVPAPVQQCCSGCRKQLFQSRVGARWPMEQADSQWIFETQQSLAMAECR